MNFINWLSFIFEMLPVNIKEKVHRNKIVTYSNAHWASPLSQRTCHVSIVYKKNLKKFKPFSLIDTEKQLWGVCEFIKIYLNIA